MLKILVSKRFYLLDRLSTSEIQKTLDKLYKQDVICGCNEKKLRLIIKKSHKKIYYVARWANQGHFHAINCRFYFSSDISGARAYVKGVIEEHDEYVKIRLNFPLFSKIMTDELPLFINESDGVNQHGASTQRAMTLLGVLHFLWERSSLNSTSRHPLSTKKLYEILRNTASLIRIQQGSLEDLLLTGTVYQQAKADEVYEKSRMALINRNQEIFTDNKKIKRAMVIIAEVKNITDERRLILKHLLGLYSFKDGIKMSEKCYENAFKSFPASFKVLANPDEKVKVFAIARIELPKDKEPYATYQIIDIALMNTVIGTRHDNTGKWWIPFDSSYEKELAEVLIKQERCFLKPLRFDAKKDFVFPDFILSDTEELIPMEVWGMQNNSNYDERKRMKECYYNEMTSNWYSWDINQAMPPLPTKTK